MSELLLQVSTQRHFVFGYGSLICPRSRQRTFSKETPAFACRVRNLRRSWNYNCCNKYTAVGVYNCVNPRGIFGVLIEIDGNFTELDKRELEYERTRIPLSDVVPLVSIPKLDAETDFVWTYTIKKSFSPTPQVPIPQSYLDVILLACSAFGEAERWLSETHGWSRHFVDDRKAPHCCKKYIPKREIEEEPSEVQLRRIDELLNKLIPEVASRRRLLH